MHHVANGKVVADKFLIVSCVLGLLYLIINPPFAVNDEDVHLARVYELASGHLITRHDQKGEYHQVPSDYLELGPRYQSVNQKPYTRVRAGTILKQLRSPRPRLPLVRMDGRAGGYSPVAYHLQIPVVWVLKRIDVGVLWHLYLARLASLAVYVVLVWRAVLIAGPLQWLFFALGTMPMSLTQAAGVSGDGLLIGLSLLYFALIAKSAVFGENTPSRAEIAGMVACLVVITLCKPVYLLFGMALPLIRCGGSRPALGRSILTTGAVVLAFGVFVGWSHIHQDPNAPPDSMHSASKQLALLLHDPRFAARLAWNTIWSYVDDILIQAIYVRHIVSNGMRFSGGLVSAIYLQLLLALAWGAAWDKKDGGVRRRLLKSAVLGLCFLLVVIAVPSALYLCCNTLGRPDMRGFQGRYLIPTMPALFLSLSLLGRPIIARWLTRRHHRAILATVIVINLYSLFNLIGWHYFPRGVDWPY